jgi:hypothetical protein
MAQIKEKENELPQIGDFSWGNKSKRKKRRPLASTSTVNGLTSVSVPQRAEINDPIFQLKGQKMTTQRVVDEQLANTIAMVLLSESTFHISYGPNDEVHLKELYTKTTQSFIKDKSELIKYETGFRVDTEYISDENFVNFPEFQRSLTCTGASLSPCQHDFRVSNYFNPIFCSKTLTLILILFFAEIFEWSLTHE